MDVQERSMRKASTVMCWFLVLEAVTAQTAPAQTGGRALPQWLTGIIAVSGFLFLTFVLFLVKKAWCEKSGRGNVAAEPTRENESVMSNGNTYEISLDTFRSKDDDCAFDNLALGVAEDKVTAM
ncbi:PDZK1-interacting protein 1 [Betta splendens]|uniref:PDZK1-interacting protein 1 n=1 Tax=Betta splendens TaxID=158456 RepID=A0A6P7MDQ4_BETSP|nr:PDZK1-interacting protein 1 [Betta splendens]